MRRTFLEDFEKRRGHVRRYMSVVHSYEREASGLVGRLATDRLHVMRAGTFLVLYNMVEATTRGAVDAIHDEMKATSTRFEKLHPELRREVILGFKRRASPDIHVSMSNLPVDFVAAALDTDHQFSGNVDARLIREIAKSYGFSTSSDSHRTRSGSDLLTIKNARNDLAHGLKTYDEVGRGYPLRDLLGISIRATRYIEAILLHIDSYLDQQLYLEASA